MAKRVEPPELGDVILTSSDLFGGGGPRDDLAWHAAIVCDVRGLVLYPKAPTFRAYAFRFGGDTGECFDLKLSDAGNTWKPKRRKRNAR